jgi:methylated-DNA-[protein]-cysteine S-methyltransferase
VHTREPTAFESKVYKTITSIPRGETRSYGWVARKIGKPYAARAVAQALARNPYAPRVPCHRVICSDGSLGGYSARGGLRRKLQLIRQEQRRHR